MNYRKLDKKMRKSKIEYKVEDKYFIVRISTDPAQNDEARKIIMESLWKNETCLNNAPGKFAIIKTYVRAYKIPINSFQY